jgi:hypothetical protein
MPVLPEVLPPVDTPADSCAPPPAPALMVTDAPFCDSVMLLPPASTKVPELTFEKPAPADVEFPPIDTAAAFAPSEIVEPAMATLRLPVPEMLEIAGALMVMVAADPAAPVAWLRDIGPEPTRTTLPVDTVPVAPAVFPPVETPKLTPPPPPPPAPLMTTEPLDTPTETFPAPANDIWPMVCVPLVPKVVFEAANIDCEMPVEAGPEITKELETQPTETIPAPDIFKLESAKDVEEEFPVVLPLATIFPTPWLVFPEIRTLPPDMPMETAPWPTKVIERAS